MIASFDQNNQNDQNISIIEIDKNLNYRTVFSNRSNGGHDKNDFKFSKALLTEIIDCLGEESSIAQKLQIPITTTNKFITNMYDDHIYLLLSVGPSTIKSNQTNVQANDESTNHMNVIGFIRFGKRDLYFDDGSSLRHLVDCPSILDFYVKYKRNGYGKMLFNFLLNYLNVEPNVLAYDRPSLSMLSFLCKHYSLNQPLWQHNHFVIFSNKIF